MAYKRLSNYYQLAKPGIIYANVMTAAAGYLLASRWHIHAIVVSGLLGGLAATIAGACAFNNYLDQGIDAKMARTKTRALVSGQMSGRQVLLFASLCSAAGLGLLLVTQNLLTTGLVAVALVDYVILYGIAKRRSQHGTLVGCLAGAMSLVAGYCAVTGQLDLGAWLLFFMMVAWQMAHFFGIALYRQADYARAGLPVMPLVRGVSSTKRQALGYMLLFIVMAVGLSITGRNSFVGGAVIVAIGGSWFVRAWRQYQLPADVWGKQTFVFSLLVVLVMSTSLAIEPLLR